MKEREGIILSGLLTALLLTWLGFLFHTSPRFAGSALGLAFGIAGAALMLIPLSYPIAKRIPWLHDRITKRVSLQTLLALHIYSGIFGPLLGMVHTGHKFNGSLGIALTTTMMLVVISGFVLRYLLTYVTREIKDKLLLLQTARGDLDAAWGVLERTPSEAKLLPKSRLLAAGLASVGIDFSVTSGPAGDVTRTAESVADLEYAIRTHEFFKRWSSRALAVHIAVSILFYILLGLHIWAGLYFGLRGLDQW